MKDEICRSCIDCAVTRCDNHTSNRPYPAFCVSKQVSDAQREASLQQYLTDEEDRKLAQVAAGIESDGYRKWPRVQETILFAKRMGYHKIGIATCVALIRESRTLAKMLRANGLRLRWASMRPTRAPAPWPATPSSRPSCSTRRGPS